MCEGVWAVVGGGVAGKLLAESHVQVSVYGCVEECLSTLPLMVSHHVTTSCCSNPPLPSFS